MYWVQALLAVQLSSNLHSSTMKQCPTCPIIKSNLVFETKQDRKLQGTTPDVINVGLSVYNHWQHYHKDNQGGEATPARCHTQPQGSECSGSLSNWYIHKAGNTSHTSGTTILKANTQAWMGSSTKQHPLGEGLDGPVGPRFKIWWFENGGVHCQLLPTATRTLYNMLQDSHTIQKVLLFFKIILNSESP